MDIYRSICITAASITLFAGVFSVALRVGPHVAPEHSEAALTHLAALFGQDLDPLAPKQPVGVLASTTDIGTEVASVVSQHGGELDSPPELPVDLSRLQSRGPQANIQLAKLGR